MATRHKKPNKRSIAAKKRWAEEARKALIIKNFPSNNSPRKGYSSPSDIVARMNEKDEPKQYTIEDYAEKIMKPIFKNKGWDIDLEPSAQTRLDIIFHDLEQAMKEVITKLKAMF